MGKLTLILGGARSGKSSLAQKLAAGHNKPVLYLATAKELDQEMENRIRAHRQERPTNWMTLESPMGIAQALESGGHHPEVILLDCLTMLVTNVVLQVSDDHEIPDEKRAEAEVGAEIDQLLARIQTDGAEWIVVSNEVGMGLVPPYPLGRMYRDILGRANQRLASAAAEVYLMVAGIPLPIHTYRPKNNDYST